VAKITEGGVDCQVIFVWPYPLQRMLGARSAAFARAPGLVVCASKNKKLVMQNVLETLFAVPIRIKNIAGRKRTLIWTACT
jgi:hypothetical protein